MLPFPLFLKHETSETSCFSHILQNSGTLFNLLCWIFYSPTSEYWSILKVFFSLSLLSFWSCSELQLRPFLFWDRISLLPKLCLNLESFYLNLLGDWNYKWTIPHLVLFLSMHSHTRRYHLIQWFYVSVTYWWFFISSYRFFLEFQIHIYDYILNISIFWYLMGISKDMCWKAEFCISFPSICVHDIIILPAAQANTLNHLWLFPCIKYDFNWVFWIILCFLFVNFLFTDIQPCQLLLQSIFWLQLLMFSIVITTLF